MARLDRLGPAKEVAQLAACLGREFTYEMLAALAATAAQNVEQLRIALNRLAGSGLVVCDGEPPAATYSFRHALVQEAAYGSLLKSRRRKLHAWIASTVERRFPDIVGAPARVAGPPSHGGWPSRVRGRALAEGGTARQGRLREQGGAIPSAPVPDGGRRAHGERAAGPHLTWTGTSWRHWSCSAIWRASQAISERPIAGTSRPWRSLPSRRPAAGSSASGTDPGQPFVTAPGSPSTSTGAAPRRCCSSLRSPMA